MRHDVAIDDTIDIDRGVEHLTQPELEAGLDHIRRAPTGAGRVELLVRRPATDQREAPDELVLDSVEGVVGDNWRARGSSSTPDGSANPEAQVTLMNARVADLVSRGERACWALAGDQVYVDVDLSVAHLPAGTRVRLGSAVLEISAKPHTGCTKFMARFGHEALRFVNSPTGRELRLRGVNCRIVTGGSVRLGDVLSVLSPA